MQYRGMKDVLDFFTSRERIFKFFDNRHLLDWMDDERYLKLSFRAKMGRPLNLETPRTFSEKLQWLKLYDRKPEYTRRVDKFTAKQLIAEKVGAEHVIPLVGGPWKHFDQIDFDALPEQFVLKCNHDSGGVVVCRDKSRLDREATRKKLEGKLANNYYMGGREWPYKNVEPCIFAEKLLNDGKCEDGIWDYKFFCFDGEPKLMFIASDGSSDPRTDFFDMDFQHMDVRMRDPSFDVLPEKPEQFEEMKRLARILSKGISHVRVDFYLVDGQVYVGEMTLYHCSGFIHINPPEWDEKIGSWLKLPEKE